MFRKLVVACMMVVLVFVFLEKEVTVSREKELSRNLIRFHVIANSDSPGDQELKREVRDAILDEVDDSFKGIVSLEQARKAAQDNLVQVEQTARREIEKHGKDYSVRAELGYFDFPAKTYGGFSLPAGNYEAVRVVLGEGKGANWWCVLFPPLCFVDISNSVSTEPPAAKVSRDLHSPGEYESEENKEPEILLKFKFLEVIDRSQHFIAEWRTKNKREL